MTQLQTSRAGQRTTGEHSQPNRLRKTFKTASSGEVCHYGEKDVTSTDQLNGDIVGLKFQETDVRKPLLVVRRLVERGHVVQFGPEPDQTCILHVETGRKIMMDCKGGSFVIKANFGQRVETAAAGFTRQAR